MQATNFGGTFDQLFLRIFLYNFHRRCLSTSSIPWCKKVKNDQKLKSRGGSCLKYLDDGDFCYPGRPTNVHGTELRSRAAIETNLRTWLDCVDNLCLPATAKLWLYQHLIVTKLSWPFTSLDLSLLFAKHLQDLAATYIDLKRWSGLPHPANVTILHTGSSKRAGLRITHLATFWKQMQAVRLDILQQSSDSRCSRLYDRLLLCQERWSRCYAPAVEHACALIVVNANPSIPDHASRM